MIRRWAQLVLGWNLLTILLGALVRATSSGAGCGRSWPTCSGEIIPPLEGAIAIEFVHRAASGVALLAVLALAIAVHRQTDAGHPARRPAFLSVVAIVIEALIGAVIVLYEWVGSDASTARIVAVPLHLTNTLFLLAALTLVVWYVRGGSRLLGRGPAFRWLVLGAAAQVAVFATGAVTALADTLFPIDRPTPTDTVHFLTELRALHPVLAIVLVLAAGIAGRGRSVTAEPALRWLIALTGGQFGIGLLSIRFGTPIALQLLHLLVADLIWISFVWLAAQLLSSDSRNVSGESVGARQTMPVQT